MMKEKIKDYQSRFENAPAEELLAFFLKEHPGELALASSLGAEDQVLTHMVLSLDPKTPVFVLDTGRLNQETYDVMHLTMKRYNFEYDVYFPNFNEVEKMVREKGPNLFYESVENRKQCCHIRKVEPLQRALANRKGWITGLRRQQSVTRKDTPVVEWDDTHNIIKLNPLVHWSWEDVWDYVKKHDVPVNILHKQGYPSIGCAPCTRAIQPGEDIRAGRWWWEQPENKECGLHIVDGKLVPKKPK